MKFQYVAVEGPIGVGKTAVVERLAQKLEAHTVLEDVGSVGDVWRRIPLEEPIDSRYWRIPPSEVPRDGGEESVERPGRAVADYEQLGSLRYGLSPTAGRARSSFSWSRASSCVSAMDRSSTREMEMSANK